MCNYKALKIEKYMQEEFSNYDNSSLKALMDSCYFEYPMITNREKEASYCTIEVIDCSYDDWWYSKLIGFQFFCKIIFGKNRNGEFIKEFLGVKLTKNKEIVFRSFEPSDVIII